MYGFGTSINDYPKISVWPDGYYVTWNIFQSSGSFLGPEACAFDRNAMLAGGAAPALVCFKLNGAFASLLPSDLDGAVPPPTGSPNFFMNIDPVSGALNEWKFHVDFTNTKNSTFTGPVALAPAPFTAPCLDTQDCIPQPGTTTKLDALGDRLMYRLAYRNFGDHASLVANHTVLEAGGNTAVRWYEVQDPNGTPTIFQQGTFAPDTDSRWMASIAMDQTGNIAVGYSVGSGVTYPSIRFTGREGGDPLGTLQAETFAVVGGGSQTGYDRWGDYSAMRIDPSDDCTFWYTQEYQATTQSADWNTRVVSFRFPSCGHALTPTTTTVVATPNPSKAGQTVVFTATVAPAGASGTVQFLDGATALGTVSLSGGTASLAVSTLATGTHSVTATYSGDSNYATSTSPVVTQIVNASSIGTTTSLASLPNPATFGQQVAFAAAVIASSGTSTPTGSVVFLDGTTPMGSAAVGGDGTATFTTSGLATGTHLFTAQYSGDGTFAASASAALSQTITKGSTTTALTSTPNPSNSGQPVTLTATISPATATGTVQFFDGSTFAGTAAVTGGTASLSLSALAVGSHAMSAVYSGDGNYLTSTSFALLQTVNATSIGTITSLASSPNPSVFGQLVVFTASVVPSSGTSVPTGTVSFMDGSTVLGSTPVNGSGVATFSTTSLAVGPHVINALYSGDATYNASSSTLTQTVNRANTATTLTSNRNPSNTGQPVTFTATVSPAIATGVVRFLDGAVLLGSAPLNGGAATLTTSNLSTGVHSITAQYVGDTTYSGSTSAALIQTVGHKK